MTKQDDNTAPVDNADVDTSVNEDAEDTSTDEGDDWDEAFDDLYEKEDTGAEDGVDDGNDEAADQGEEEDTQEKTSGNEDVVGKTDDNKEESTEADPAEEQRRIVREALKEVYNEQQEVSVREQELTNEALNLIHPEGIEDPRRDSDGDPIRGPEDVEQLYNPNTGEKFTPEEARQWYAQATRQYEQNVRQATAHAAYVANVSMRLEKGREAVMRNYGDFIQRNPDIAEKVLNRYMSTVKIAGEGENQYIADAPIDILEFYNDVMYPYVELEEKKREAEEAAEAARKAKEDALKRSKAHRDESRDFPATVGEDASKTGEESDWDDAFKQYYGR